ncbi:solute carrier family 40 member 1-like isoform X2 [Pomacea canaliculata]|uniref:solute carrier family 40 member 1-like isoform X2 n=1 Tax=Pomacea canaliculata TaxID=400727 RepID=UPI000D7393E7|nr:solute carrier family 40 member 1-like isoform X2 [Pomacea canaliculata]
MTKKTNLYVYFSHFLSAWGDRMWSFGVGLFLVRIASENLQLPATYGLASGLSIFLLGALVGDWVDSTPRLKAAQLSLVLQNCCVVLCAGVVYAYILLEDVLSAVEGGWAVPLCHAFVIIVAILSDLASLARVIAVERDWIVKICGTDTDSLAKMTAVLRRIDQTTLILAPVATGQVMTFAGLENGALFIAGWNLASVGLEYYLMWKVYKTMPALSARKDRPENNVKVVRRSNVSSATAQDKLHLETSFSQTPACKTPFAAEAHNSQEKLLDSSNVVEYSEAAPLLQQHTQDSKTFNTEAANCVASPILDENSITCEVSASKTRAQGRDRSCCGRLLYQVITLYRGWRTYMQYNVALAGLALACLYMTVLGFDNITVAYAVTQGVSESITGVLMGVSAVFGLIGTCVYPALHRRTGLARTGIIALTCQIGDVNLTKVEDIDNISTLSNTLATRFAGETVRVSSSTLHGSLSKYQESSTADILMTSVFHGNLTLAAIGSQSYEVPNGVTWSDTSLPPEIGRGPTSYVSVIFLMAGIVLARFGLWMADLSITQLFLESVKENERGIVNGVQSSLNKLMDVLKFLLVVAIPDTETFGFLIIISYAFICLGWLLYAIFFRKFCHFYKTERPLPSGYNTL